jgi:hypothetical protein
LVIEIVARNAWSSQQLAIQPLDHSPMRQNLADWGPGGSRTRAVGPHTSSCGQSLAHLDLSKILSLASSPWVGVDMGECSSTPLGGFGELALANWAPEPLSRE